MSVVVRVPAKVNLHLGVGALRPDGYHELVNVFHAVDLVDEVVAHEADGLQLAVHGDLPGDGVPTDKRNLAWQAAELLAAHAGRPAHVRLEIAKAIPVAGGMAGGSADAAATLVACAALWGVASAELPALAARLGADVAFPLLGGTAVGTGRGEVLTPIETRATFHWVFALAGYGISAADAYREFDRRGGAPGRAPDAVIDAVRAGDPRRLGAALHNDLQPGVLTLAPALRKTLDAGHELGAMGGVVSGSGPTCAFLCADAEDATRLAAVLAAEGHPTRIASGPVAGATVLP